jgi:hypothetical protein
MGCTGPDTELFPAGCRIGNEDAEFAATDVAINVCPTACQAVGRSCTPTPLPRYFLRLAR